MTPDVPETELHRWHDDGAPLPEHTEEEPARCDRCGWPLAKTVKDGCVPGNCAQRPLPKRPLP